MMQPRWKKSLLTLSMAVLPAAAGGPSWAEYTGEETFTFYVGIFKPILWMLMDSDIKNDPSTPMYEGEHKFDLEEFVEPNGYPTGAGRTQTGNIVLADANHINFGTGARFGLAKLVNIGTEFGAKVRDFKTENPPQPSGTATENFFRITVAVAYGR